MRRLSIPLPHRPPAVLAMLALLVLALCAARLAPRSPEPTAFVGVTVVPMDREGVLEDYTVVVRGDRIVEVGPRARVRVPADARRIDGTGRWLVPGLAEMHGHLPGPNVPPDVASDVLFLFVSQGVTTVRGMQGHPSQFALRERVRAGELLGPTLYLGSPALHGRSAPTPEEGERLVHTYHDYDLLKVHEELDAETYAAIAGTARELGLAWGGHVSDAVGLERALEAGQSSIDHLDGYPEAVGDDESRIAVLAARTREARAWVVPTMALWDAFLGADLDRLRAYPELRYVPRDWVDAWERQLRSIRSGLAPEEGARQRELRRRILHALAEAGAGILLGSDAPQIFSVPGFSIHREMRVMVEAGLSPREVLRSGTRSVAEYFGETDEFGTIAAGRRADLILLEADPLEDVAHLARRAGVMVRGRWIPEAEIRARLEAIAAARAR